MDVTGGLRSLPAVLRRLHWIRGLRAGLAVAGAMTVCRAFPQSIGWAAGWAALGGFEAILVDNGGPYRSRFATIFTLMAGGSLACIAAVGAYGFGSVSSVMLPMAATAVFCFVVTFARVATQPIASTSVIILVIYFAALGSGARSLKQALWHALAFVLGAAWAGALSLVLWPVDPYRPARLGVAACYQLLAEFSSTIEPTRRGSDARELARKRAFEWQRQMRLRMETARSALAVTAARAPSRTVRARNLTVLLETADMLLALTMRATELALALEIEEQAAEEPAPLQRLAQWLSDAEWAIARGLRRRPEGADSSKLAGCAASGTLEAQQLRELASEPAAQGAVLAHLAAAELDAAQNIEIACEAVKAVWSGAEASAGTLRLTTALETSRGTAGSAKPLAWADALRANWTLDSTMMRHALRIAVVGAADVLLLRVLHLTHGFWLGMTSIIVLQPYRSNTLKRGVERVGGTIAGGVLAAALAAAISTPAGITTAVTLTSVLTLATYAVDYAWYCFFLTPTFVLLSLPHLRDWQYSGVRMLTTVLGAAVAVAAMRLLWPQREELALRPLLARAAAADAAYVKAMLLSWRLTKTAGVPADEQRQAADRELLAPARRACGLASNDAEESLDRLMLEPGLRRLTRGAAGAGSTALTEHALTFVTYIRRLTQSITTMAVLGRGDQESVTRLEQMAGRLSMLQAGLLSGSHYAPQEPILRRSEENDSDVATHQLQRMERQVAVLERAASSLL